MQYPTVWKIQLCLFFLPCLVSAEVYYVTPASNISCPGEPCLTVSEYATQPRDYFSLNTTLVFIPGEHILSHTFILRDIDELLLTSTGSESLLYCILNDNLEIRSIEKVLINDLTIVGCYGNNVTDVHHFTIKHSHVQGVSKNVSQTAFDVSNIQKFLVFNSSFVLNEVEETQTIACSVLKLQNSNIDILYSNFEDNSATSANFSSTLCVLYSNVTIQDSSFTNNRGITGGVVYSENSTVRALRSHFSNNCATTCGGVGYISCSTSLFLDSCTLNDNKSNGDGGVMCLLVNSTVETRHSLFQHNIALKGGTGGVLRLTSGSTAVFLNSSFVDNQANNSGVISSYDWTKIDLINSTFYNNKAISPNKDNGYGGTLNTERNVCIITTGCTFENNFASKSGGCMYLRNVANLQIYGSNVFKNNSAGHYGGAFTVADHSTINIGIGHNNISESQICDSYQIRFFGNSAEHGGVLNVIDNSVAHVQCSSFEYNRVNCLQAGCSSFDNRANCSCRGGAILVRTNTTLHLVDTYFHANQAIGKGGVIFAQFASIMSDGSLTVDSNEGGRGVIYVSSCHVNILGNSTFSNNNNSFLAHNSDITFTEDTTFYGGMSKSDREYEGGAITASRSTIVFNNTLLVENNYGVHGGAILAYECVIICNGQCSFYDNSAEEGGAVYAYKTELKFKGVTNFSANSATVNGGGIFTLGSTIQYYSQNSSFTENTALKGGAIYFDQTSTLTIVKKKMECTGPINRWYCITENWMELVFVGNSATEKGGAIYKEDNSTCSSVPFEDVHIYGECFIQTIAVYERANDWEPDRVNFANINFTNNSASDGAMLYGGLLDRCAINMFAEQKQILDTEPVPLTYFSDMSLTNFSYSEIASDPVKICFCENGTINCNLPPPNYYVKRGQTFNVSIAILDQVNKSLDGHVMASLFSESSRLGEGQSKRVINDTCSVLCYNIFSASSETLYLYPLGPCADNGISKVEIGVKIDKNCPVGFTLSKSSLECICGPEVKGYISNCSLATESVVREGSFWICSVIDDNSTSIVIHDYCPYDYCYPPTDRVEVNLNYENGSNAQCAFNRSGPLCGSCVSGYSLTLGSSKCAKCSNYWLLLIFPFSLAGIGLVVLMMVCNLTLASGTINGLLFYANILVANRTTFFPPQKQDVLTVFVSWLGLNLGIATCFYDGMDGFGKMWVQISFEVYLIILVIVIILLGKNTRVSYFFHRYKLNPVHTLATLVMLSYEKLSRKVFSLLSYTHLKYPNETKTVWLFDPSNDYMEGKHISLAIVASSIVITGVIFNTVLLFSKSITAMSKSVCVNSFIQAFSAPFKPKHQYWAGLLLLIRNISYFVSEFLNANGNPDHNLSFIFTLLMGILVLKLVYVCFDCNCLTTNRRNARFNMSYANPPLRSQDNDIVPSDGVLSGANIKGIVYNNPLLDLLETFFLVNLSLLIYFTLYIRGGIEKKAILFYISSSIVLVTFISIVIYHVYVYITFLVKRMIVDNENNIGTTEGNLHSYNDLSSEGYGATVATPTKTVIIL